MSDTEKLLLFGLVGLIAWELWPKQQPQLQSLVNSDPLSNTPIWVQQLSAAEQAECSEPESVLECLLSIPQGPGGTYTNHFEPINYFNPTRGILGLCDQTPGSVRSRTWSLS